MTRTMPRQLLDFTTKGLITSLYPPQCVQCGTLVTSDFGLCGQCWRDTPFISGTCCAACGLPIHDLAEASPPSPPDPQDMALCEDCHQHPRPWHQGRAAMLYAGLARQMILALKHGDRMDLARPMAGWLAKAAEPLLRPDMLIIPIPLHWTRLFTRRYNQAAVLGHALAAKTGLAHCPDALIRCRNTGTQEGRSHAERFAALQAAFRPAANRQSQLQARPVLLLDDVMTSGATFAAATRCCHAAGASSVSVLALARVAKNT